MSRKKSKIVSLKTHNKNCRSKHNCPRELDLVAEEIEKLSFVTEPVGKLRWAPMHSSHKKGIKIVGFDDNKKGFPATVYGGYFKQDIFIKVDIPKEAGLLECKCLKLGMDVVAGKENCYYYNQLKDFYKGRILDSVKNFYK